MKQEFIPRQDKATVKHNSSTLQLINLKGHSIEELAAAANVSVDIIQAAIDQRQKGIDFEMHKEELIKKDQIPISKKTFKRQKPNPNIKKVHKVSYKFKRPTT